MLATNDNSSIKSSDLSNLMSYCFCTEHYYTNPIHSFKYTDGVKIFCEKAQSYWLLDIVNSVCRFYKRMHQDLIIIKLEVNKDNKASISFEDTYGIFFSQIIPFTDCPEGTWMFYFNDNVFFWNGEY